MSADRPLVVVTRRWPAPVEARLCESFDTRLNETDEPFTKAQLREALAAADALCVTVTDRLDAACFEGLVPKVRLIANFGVGFNHIDRDAAARHGIRVSNTPGVLTDCTADLAMTLLLMTARRTGEGERELRAGRWQGWRPTHLLGTRVSGKTLGIVGAGRIGLALAQRARFGFGMKILLSGRSAIRPEVLNPLDAEDCTLDELLNRSDFVSLHCPATPETRHLIDAQRLARMPAHGILVNTARGDIVDESALAAALARGQIGGAGLDVYEREPEVNAQLLDLENVVLLPHLGSGSRETRIAMGMCALNNLRACFDGQPLPNPV
ncbi:MAG: D-glycerate dehydrogenase [Pseudomonadales bacterium]|nr:D-glycerate dehydrogenase [Pseudomonadales bacterium]